VSESTRADSLGFRPSRLLPEGWMLLLGAAALGLLLGVASAIRPELAVAAAIGLVLAPLVFAVPVAGLCVLLFLSFLDSFSHVSSALSLTKIVGLLLLLGWFGRIAMGDRSQKGPGLLSRNPGLAAAIVVFTVWAALSLTWAERPSAGTGAVARFALNFALFPIMLLAVRERRHVVWLFAVFIAGALTSAVYGLIHPLSTQVGRLGGVGLNPNQIGAFLIVAVIFGATLAANDRWPPLARAVTLAASGGAAVLLFLTLSRAALVGLGVALIAAPFAAGRGRRAAAVLLAVAVVGGTVGWFAAFASHSAKERVLHPAQRGGSGREDLWRIGWRMVEAHPVRGVGAGNFPDASIHYLLRPGVTQNDYLIVDKPTVPHNIYLAALSELGTVGFVLFVLILVSALRCIIRAARLFGALRKRSMELLSRGLLVALAGYMTALFFSSQIYDKQLWLLLALGPPLLLMAEGGDVVAERA
jgi:O-antigen ligase